MKIINLKRFLALILVSVITTQSGAIIIRHDKGYGDYVVRESQFPAVFYLQRQADRKVCVATLIHPRWAITAAHCVKETQLMERLSSGEPLNVSIANRNRVVNRVIVHPDYLPDTADEVDLALLQFAIPVDFPLPIALNRSDEEVGQVVTIMGWGYFGFGTLGRQYDDGKFRMAKNRIESAARRLQIRFDDPRDINAEVLQLEGMPGLGDSGGPALLESAGGWLLAGIAVGELMDDSFSEETQGSYGSIAIYERVSQHQQWISQTIESNTFDVK